MQAATAPKLRQQGRGDATTPAGAQAVTAQVPGSFWRPPWSPASASGPCCRCVLWPRSLLCGWWLWRIAPCPVPSAPPGPREPAQQIAGVQCLHGSMVHGLHRQCTQSAAARSRPGLRQTACRGDCCCKAGPIRAGPEGLGLGQPCRLVGWLGAPACPQHSHPCKPLTVALPRAGNAHWGRPRGGRAVLGQPAGGQPEQPAGRAERQPGRTRAIRWLVRLRHERAGVHRERGDHEHLRPGRPPGCLDTACQVGYLQAQSRLRKRALRCMLTHLGRAQPGAADHMSHHQPLGPATSHLLMRPILLPGPH